MCVFQKIQLRDSTPIVERYPLSDLSPLISSDGFTVQDLTGWPVFKKAVYYPYIYVYRCSNHLRSELRFVSDGWAIKAWQLLCNFWDLRQVRISNLPDRMLLAQHEARPAFWNKRTCKPTLETHIFFFFLGESWFACSFIIYMPRIYMPCGTTCHRHPEVYM